MPPLTLQQQELLACLDQYRYSLTLMLRDRGYPVYVTQEAVDSACEVAVDYVLSGRVTTLGNRRAWLRTIARNFARRLAARVMLPLDADLPVRDGGSSELMSSALEAVDRLPEQQRRVVELHILGGLTIGETAREMGIRPGTVSARLRAARASLSRLLDEKSLPGRSRRDSQ